MAEDKKKGFKDILEDKPSDALADAMLNRCEGLYGKGNMDETIACCTDIQNKKPELIMPYYYKGMAYYNKGNFEQAIAEFDAGLKKDSKFWLLYSSKGLVRFGQGKYEDALKMLNESLKYKTDVSTLVLACVCAIMTQNNVLAEGYIKKAASIDVKASIEIFDSFLSGILSSGVLSKEIQNRLESGRQKMKEELEKLEEAKKNSKKNKKK